MIRVPIKVTSPDFSFPIELDGKTWIFRFRWNHRLEQWVLDVHNADGKALLLGKGVVINVPLLNRFAYLGVPSGILMALPSSPEDHTRIAYEDLGARVELFYMTAAELAAEAANRR